MKKEVKISGKNKRGWVRIVEAFVAILIIIGLLLVFIGNSYVKKSDPTERIYEIESSILQDIQSNYSMRDIILSASPLPVPWFAMSPGISPFRPIYDKIVFEQPSWLNCIANICAIDDPCQGIGVNLEENLYVKSVIISANTTTYNPRQLKMFCWLK